MHRHVTPTLAGSLLVAVVLFAGASRAEAAAILSIDPSVKDVYLGDSFFLDVMIADVEDLFAYDVELTFDPAIVNADAAAASDGTFLSANGTELTLASLLGLTAGDNNAEGTAFAADTRFFPPGASGSGWLFRMMFTAVGLGETVIGFDTDCNLVDDFFCTALRNSNTDTDPSGDPIPYSVVTGLVRVTARPVAVPEPALLALLAVGLASRRVRRRRRAR